MDEHPSGRLHVPQRAPAVSGSNTKPAPSRCNPLEGTAESVPPWTPFAKTGEGTVSALRPHFKRLRARNDPSQLRADSGLARSLPGYGTTAFDASALAFGASTSAFGALVRQ